MINNICKNRRAVFAVLVLFISCAVVLAGCSGGNVSDIAISSANSPRQTYVQGQDLDLSVGALTAMVKGDATSVPLDADGVEITGYDKNQVGKQTLTISYKGKTTTFDVTVVARMAVENQETSYFVGDSLDVTKGRVKVTNDDGSVVILNLDSQDLTITGFNTASAGTVTVNVAYGSYSASFDVTVYSAGDVVFTKPTKTVYQSHETELALNGGYLTVTAVENPQFSKYVNITADMVSGFDPAAATREYKDQHLKQTLTVNYAGQSFQYEISVLYGAISMIRDNAKLLEGLDWSDTVTLTTEQGEAAKEAVEAYLNLTSFDKALVDAAVLETVARPAAQYLTELLAEEAKTFSDSFTLNETGGILLVGKSSEQMEKDVYRLADDQENFNVYADLLRQMKETFADMEMTKDVTMEEYIVVTPEEEVALCVDVFEFLLILHDTLKDIPEDWKVEDLANYADNISTAVYLIQANGMIGPNFNYIFEVLANWRTNDDYFDIIYSYYCYVAEDGEAFLFEYLWQQLPLPGDMQDWYLAFYNAVVEAQYMEQYGESDAYLRDTTNFMYYYFEALRLSEEIKNGDNQFYKDVYEIIRGDDFMDQNVVSVTGGYVAHSNGMVDSEVYNRLWKTYLGLVALYNKGEVSEEVQSKEFAAIFDAFTDLAPTEVFGFLSSLQYMYSETNGTFLALDYSNKANNTFVYLIANYYIGKMPETARPLVQQMLLAMEYYGIYCAVGADSEGLENFTATMQGMATALAELSSEDRAVFDSLMGECYSKYLNIYNVVAESKEYNIDQSAMDQIENLKETIQAFYELSEYMSAEDRSDQELKAACVLLYALYEKANSIYGDLLASGNEDAITLLYTKQYALLGVEETLETAFFKVRNNFIWTMFFGVRFEQRNEEGEVVTVLSTWAIYEKTQLRTFLRDAADLLWAGNKGTAAQLDPAYVAKITEALRQLDSESLIALYRIGSGRYFDSLQQFLHSQMAGDTDSQDLATAILEAEFGYMVYETYAHAETERDYFKTQFEEARALYEQLTDMTNFDAYLKEIYEHYEAIYNSL